MALTIITLSCRFWPKTKLFPPALARWPANRFVAGLNKFDESFSGSSGLVWAAAGSSFSHFRKGLLICVVISGFVICELPFSLVIWFWLNEAGLRSNLRAPINADNALDDHEQDIDWRFLIFTSFRLHFNELNKFWWFLQIGATNWFCETRLWSHHEINWDEVKIEDLI